MASTSSAKIAAFVAETQQSLGTSDRELLDRAKASPHSLKRLRAGKRVGDDLLHRLASAAERLRLERGPALAEREKWLQIARELMIEKGGRNKLATALGISGPYLGRVVGGKKRMTAELIERLKMVSMGRVRS
jgi:transcriptional regulator with XRE-family HTH domain